MSYATRQHAALLQIDLVNTGELRSDTREELEALCRAAYNEDLADYFVNVGPGLHLFGRVGAILVSHAMVVERWLHVVDGPHLRTAYVELVATRPDEQRRGHASALMRRLAQEIRGYDIGGLSPSEESFYARLGWERWRGPLQIRRGTTMVPSPDEQLMVLRLPRTPAAVSLDAAVSIEWRPGEVW